MYNGTEIVTVVLKNVISVRVPNDTDDAGKTTRRARADILCVGAFTSAAIATPVSARRPIGDQAALSLLPRFTRRRPAIAKAAIARPLRVMDRVGDRVRDRDSS